ncbi:MAG TPA: site-2 protease family protein [Terriglobales bacterium]|nr:site-2 protease family protein [Terriglobales bacterium]
MSGPAFLLWRVPRRERWQPPWPPWRWALPLFFLTLLTTTVVGARLQYNFVRNLPAYRTNDDLFPFLWAWHHPGQLAGGLAFSLALMSILLAHELGHFLACRYYRLDSTFPLFLPAPTLIGTMGAFIRIKAAFNDRRELLDVGIAGPLAGIALTLPLLLYGVATSHVLSPAQAMLWRQQWIEFGWTPLARWAAAWLHPGVAPSRIALSPVARAAWMGLLVTMLNLLPAAQLDGGHILYACSPRLHAITSWASLGVLALAGWFYWPGWYMLAAFILLMRVRHPFVPQFEPLGRARTALAWLAVLIFLVSFTLLPVVSS